MTECTLPRQHPDARYVYGHCTWHGPIARADAAQGGRPVCPECGGDLMEAPNEESFWASVRQHGADLPNYEEIVRWGRGKCFPDFDTLQNAWRQAMEGQS